MRAALLAPSSLELWRKERAKRQLSFWWKTLHLIGHYGIAFGNIIRNSLSVNSQVKLESCPNLVVPCTTSKSPMEASFLSLGEFPSKTAVVTWLGLLEFPDPPSKTTTKWLQLGLQPPRKVAKVIGGTDGPPHTTRALFVSQTIINQHFHIVTYHNLVLLLFFIFISLLCCCTAILFKVD